MMPGMTDMQYAFVTDRVAALEHDAAAIRAERERDHLREHTARGTDATDHPADLPPRRVRLGRWLVGVGEAIAGSPASRRTTATGNATATSHDPGDDGPDRLAPAA